MEDINQLFRYFDVHLKKNDVYIINYYNNHTIILIITKQLLELLHNHGYLIYLILIHHHIHLIYQNYLFIQVLKVI